MSQDTIKISMKPFQDYYESKDWIKALQWLEANKMDLGSGIYNFNMGTVSIKMNQLSMARYYFERAKHAGFEDPWVYKNIEAIRQDLGLVAVETRSFYEKIQANIYSFVCLDIITSFLLLATVATLGIWIKQKIRLTWIRLTVVSTFLVAFAAYLLFSQESSLRLLSSNEAIIIQEAAIFEGPSSIFEELGRLPEGLKVKLDQEANGWANVVAPENFRGWIQIDEKTLKKLD